MSLPDLAISYRVPERRWRVVLPYVYQDGETSITIPQGFETDLASVPRALWTIIAPFELSIIAPVVHDLIYQHGGEVTAYTDPPRRYTRGEADALFERIMTQEGVPDWRRHAAYDAVREAGASHWRAG